MDRYAAIDVGSNSILLCVGERDEHGSWRWLLDTGEIVRLSEELGSSRELKLEAMDRAMKILGRFAEMARSHSPREILAVGTECLRAARNGGVFLERAKQECGLSIEVISGEEEARLSFVAVQQSIPLPPSPFVLFDVGGGSTEVVFGEGSRIEQRLSINLGAASLTEQYLVSDPVTPEEMTRLSDAVEKKLAPISRGHTVAALVGMGGTMTNLGSVMLGLSTYEATIVHGAVVPFSEVERQMEVYRLLPIEERRRIRGLQPKREDIILAGVCIVHAMMERLKAETVIISDQGIRHGLLYDRYGA